MLMHILYVMQESYTDLERWVIYHELHPNLYNLVIYSSHMMTSLCLLFTLFVICYNAETDYKLILSIDHKG